MASWNYQYHLPQELIAQTPADPRDSSRLLFIDKSPGTLSHHQFSDLPKLLKPNDVLVFNQSKVFPARLFGNKSSVISNQLGGKVELLLLKKISTDTWEVISHPGIKPSQTINFSNNISARVLDYHHIKFNKPLSFSELSKIGLIPLPPYIHSNSPQSTLRKQYQTVYANQKFTGSAAAPTAGLHFTSQLLQQLTTNNLQLEFLTLHVGLGTFKSPSPEQIASSHLHSEWYSLNRSTAHRLNIAKKFGRRIIAVGTTTTRVLETCADTNGILHPQSGETDIFIQPDYKFKFVDGLITNFHLPGTSLLMLVSALATPEIIRQAYQVAVNQKYRFYSFGDATLIV